MKRWLSVGILLTLGMLLLTGPGQADDCRVIGQPIFSQPTYGTPVYSQPIYSAPTYETIRYREVLVPVLQPLPVFVDPRISYVYNGGNYVQVPLVPGPNPGPNGMTPAAQASPPAKPPGDTDLDALIDRIEKRVRERNQSELPSEPEGPPVVPGFKRPPQQAPRTSLQILTTRCASCHTGERSKGDFVIFDRPGVLSASFDHNLAWDAINTDRMPYKRPALSAADKAVLRREWGIG
jgi:hypothetical protein